jgi:hypothetical protein
MLPSDRISPTGRVIAVVGRGGRVVWSGCFDLVGGLAEGVGDVGGACAEGFRLAAGGVTGGLVLQRVVDVAADVVGIGDQPVDGHERHERGDKCEEGVEGDAGGEQRDVVAFDVALHSGRDVSVAAEADPGRAFRGPASLRLVAPELDGGIGHGRRPAVTPGVGHAGPRVPDPARSWRELGRLCRAGVGSGWLMLGAVA